MSSSYAHGHLASGRPPLLEDAARHHAPPAQASAVTFVSKFLLASIGIVALIALVVTAPLGVTVPIGVALFIYLMGTLLLSAGKRSQQVHLGADPVLEDAMLAKRARHVGALAVVSLLLLALAAWVPERLGAAMAVLGLIGLFFYRIIAMPYGWASQRPPDGGRRD